MHIKTFIKNYSGPTHMLIRKVWESLFLLHKESKCVCILAAPSVMLTALVKWCLELPCYDRDKVTKILRLTTHILNGIQLWYPSPFIILMQEELLLPTSDQCKKMLTILSLWRVVQSGGGGEFWDYWSGANSCTAQGSGSRGWCWVVCYTGQLVPWVTQY